MAAHRPSRRESGWETLDSVASKLLKYSINSQLNLPRGDYRDSRGRRRFARKSGGHALHSCPRSTIQTPFSPKSGIRSALSHGGRPLLHNYTVLRNRQ